MKRYDRFYKTTRASIMVMAILLIVTGLITGCAAANDKEPTVQPQSRVPLTEEASQPAPPQKEPKYVYYVKDGTFLRADVNGPEEEGKNPQVLMKDIAPNITLKDYYDVKHAEDGSFSAFQFAVSDAEDIWDTDEVLVVVNHETGAAQELGRGFFVWEIDGNRMLYQTELQEDHSDFMRGPALYEYTIGKGKQLVANNTNQFYGDWSQDRIVYTKYLEDGSERLYVWSMGKETPLLTGEEASSSEVGNLIFGRSGLYQRWTATEAEIPAVILSEIGMDGTIREILTEEELAVTCMLNPDDGSLYYTRGADNSDFEETGIWRMEQELFYIEGDTRESHPVTEDIIIWEEITVQENGTYQTILLCKKIEGENQGIYAVVDGQAYGLEFPGSDEEWIASSSLTTNVIGDCIYMTFTQYDDLYQPSAGKIYYTEWDGAAFSDPVLKAEGCGLTPLLHEQTKEGKELFYADLAPLATDDSEYRSSLYLEGKKLMEHYFPGSLMAAGPDGAEYFALMKEDDHDDLAPSLVRLDTSGSSETILEQVVQCEPWADGIIMLTDCTEDYPYTGNLCLYDGKSCKVIDQGVSMFFEKNAEHFVDAVPDSWDWSGMSGK